MLGFHYSWSAELELAPHTHTHTRARSGGLRGTLHMHYRLNQEEEHFIKTQPSKLYIER